MPLPAAAIPALIQGGSALIQGFGNWIVQKNQRREERREYNKMLAYNSPASQMQRFREAGLSPYLMYGQGSSGNVSSPAPANAVIPEKFNGNALDTYMSVANFDEDIKSKRLQNSILANEVSRSHWKTISEGLGATRRELDMLSDYPNYQTWQDYSKTKYSASYAPGHAEVTDSYRRKLNEAKLSMNKAMLDKTLEAIRGMSSDNMVREVKARYAKEYGMVGGDWTQGLGLIKSLPSFFKSRAKSISSPPLKSGVRYNSPTSWKKLGY